MSAVWIIPTSLPPSPIPRTTLPVKCLTPSVIVAFCVGDVRQQTTAGAFDATVKKNYFWWVNAVLIDIPSITRTVFVFTEN